MSDREPQLLIAALGRSEEPTTDIAEAALALSLLESPDADVKGARDHLKALVYEAQRIFTSDARGTAPEALAETLSRTIAEQFLYQGDRESYDDLRNADLVETVRRRRGLPVTLGIIYIHVARALGAEAYGVNFPGHFLVALDTGNGHVVVDPFNGGRVVMNVDLKELLRAVMGEGADLAPDHLQKMSDRHVLVRLLNNIRGRAKAAQDWVRLAAVTERMLLLVPDDGALWFDAGASYAQTERPGAAVKAFARALESEPDASWAGAARASLTALKKRLN